MRPVVMEATRFNGRNLLRTDAKAGDRRWPVLNEMVKCDET